MPLWINLSACFYDTVIYSMRLCADILKYQIKRIFVAFESYNTSFTFSSFQTCFARSLGWMLYRIIHSLQWRQDGHASVSNHQPHDCLLNRLFKRRSQKTSKLRVTGLCVGNSPGTGEIPTQRASDAENVSISWHHHVLITCMIWNIQISPSNLVKWK